MINHNERIHYIFYSLLSFIIVISTGDLKKYLFTLDFPIGPKVYYKGLFQTFYGFEAPIWGGHLLWKLFYSSLTLIFSAPVMQKLLLFLFLFLSGYSAYRSVPVKSQNARLFAGLLYMLNPYTYVRIVAGHWLILISYALLPLALKSFIELLEKGERKEIIRFIFLLTLVGLNSHTLVIAFIAMVVIFVFHFWRTRNIKEIKNIVIAGTLFIVLNSYWLIPSGIARNTLVSNIGDGDIDAFAPLIESFSALFTLASMHGFWREGYLYSKDFIPYWQIIFMFILFIVVRGFISYYSDEKIGIYVKAFGIIAISGLVLSAGINSPISEFFRWLFDNTILKGMRDSHKFVTLVVMSYSYLGALGISDLEKIYLNNITKYKKAILKVVIIAALLAPLIYSFTFFNGFAGQLRSVDYPDDWYKVDTFLNNDRDEFKVLFLPWHQYMDFHWLPGRDKRIANPAQNFFNKDVITGKNVEIGEIYRQVYSPDQAYIDFLLSKRTGIENFGELIASLNIKYILLTKEADYREYVFLFNQSDLEIVMETENFYIFKNKNEVSKIYEVGSVIYLKDWNELLERSKQEDITQNLYITGNSSRIVNGIPGKRSPAYEKKSPVKYELEGRPLTKYLVFTEPFSENWEYNGEKPILAYGVVNAYEVKETNNTEIIYENFYSVYLLSYVVSIFSFIILIAFYSGLIH